MTKEGPLPALVAIRVKKCPTWAYPGGHPGAILCLLFKQP